MASEARHRLGDAHARNEACANARSFPTRNPLRRRRGAPLPAAIQGARRAPRCPLIESCVDSGRGTKDRRFSTAGQTGWSLDAISRWWLCRADPLRRLKTADPCSLRFGFTISARLNNFERWYHIHTGPHGGWKPPILDSAFTIFARLHQSRQRKSRRFVSAASSTLRIVTPAIATR